ncbi:N-acetylglucosamine kinase [Bernardetia sp.]|uniref:N-acetylglucosamine kinase n=1 Tax=Bernardetia sp. TaxID=1937974 RepID=UPI0025BB792F|nr:N-acetylglucosamine kinase [Bernardetia sp.]
MILYADSGSTKTDWALKTDEGKIFRWKSGGWNPYFLTTEQMVEEGKNFINQHYFENQNESTDFLEPYLCKVEEIQFYGAGSSTEANRKIVYEALKTLFPQAKKIEVAHDLLGAARSVYDNSKDEMGIIMILGTGSNACLYDGKNILKELTNLGFWLGDEGSGGFIGKQFVIDFLHGALPNDIHDLFYKEYGLTREKVLKRAYQEPKPNEFFASFVPFLHKHKKQKFIREFLESCFDEFLDRIRVEFEGEELSFYAVGSVGYYFEDILKRQIEEMGGELVRVVKSPIEGLIEK